MEIGYVVELDEDEEYLLLNKVKKNKKDYYLAIGVNKDDTVNQDDITFFEEIIENGETYLKEIFEKKLLDELSDASMLQNLKELKNIKKILENYYKQEKDS